MKHKFKFLLLLAIYNPVYGFDSIKKILGTILTFPIAHKDASDEVSKLSQETVDIIDPNIKLNKVKKLNRFGQLLIGYQNTVAIPFLNFLIVNPKWLKKLPEGSQKFIIGRAAVHLSNRTEYTAYKYLLPFLLHNFLKQVVRKGLLKRHSSDGLKVALMLFTRLVTSHFSRSLEYQADMEAAYKLKCPDLAVKTLKYINKFKHDKSILGAISSAVPLLKLLNWFLCIPVKDIVITSKCYGIEFFMLPIGNFFEVIEFHVPGRINNVSNRLESFIIHLPILNWICNFPRISDRIKQLRRVEKKIRKEEK